MAEKTHEQESISLDRDVVDALRRVMAERNLADLSQVCTHLLSRAAHDVPVQPPASKHQSLSPPGVHSPQARYSHVSRVGDHLYISGQMPLNEKGELVGLGDAEKQAEQCFLNIEAIVQHFGGSLKNVFKTTTYITNWNFRGPVGKARDRILSEPYPANTLVVISGLAQHEMLVEIEAIAIL